MINKKISYERLVGTMKKQFDNRQMEFYYVDNRDEARKLIISLMPEQSKVSFGGSMTLNEIGVLDELRNSDYMLYDRSVAKDADEVRETYLNAFDTDYYLMSANAVTIDGKLINVDGNGNRVAALIYGPKNVIVVAGMNKVVTDEAEGRARVKLKASPANTIRLNIDTPCAKTGVCHSCITPNTICCQTVITRYSRSKGRIKVIMVGEELGY